MEKASEFIKRYTKDLNGKSYIDAVGAITELWARMMTAQNNIKTINEALGYYVELDERINKLEGNKKIDIVSELEAKTILKRS